MDLRWTAPGMLNAERCIRRLNGYRQIPQFVAALHLHAHPEAAAATEIVGTAAYRHPGSSPQFRMTRTGRLSVSMGPPLESATPA